MCGLCLWEMEGLDREASGSLTLGPILSASLEGGILSAQLVSLSLHKQPWDSAGLRKAKMEGPRKHKKAQSAEARACRCLHFAL